MRSAYNIPQCACALELGYHVKKCVQHSEGQDSDCWELLGNLQESSPYLSSVPLRINNLPNVDEHLRVEWEPYPVWGTSCGFVSSDEFYQFPLPKSRKQVRFLIDTRNFLYLAV
jgi:hypothetical protein